MAELIAKSPCAGLLPAPVGAVTLAEDEIQLPEPQLTGPLALEEAIAKSPDPGVTRVAALRLARVLIAEGNLAAASELVAKHDDGGSFAGAFAAVRGEIAQADGRAADARAAYEQAIATGAPDPEQLRLKLDNLPPPAQSGDAK